MPHSAIATTTIGEGVDIRSLKEISGFYSESDDANVASFLKEHPAVVEILCRAMPELRRHFGSEAETKLRLMTDEDDWQILYASVLWPGDAAEVRRALARFDTLWWFAHSDDTANDLSFTYELV